jgi:hypothetical protein
VCVCEHVTNISAQSAQEQAHDVRKMVYNERKFRMEAHEGFVECRNLVEASSDALSEWEPMIQALTRHPPVSISEMASALNRQVLPRERIILHVFSVCLHSYALNALLHWHSGAHRPLVK